MRKRLLSLVTLALVSNVVPAFAVPQLMWQDYEQSGFMATRKKIYQSAELALTNRLELINSAPNPNERVVLSFLERLIVVCASQSKYADVEAYCTLALRFCEKGKEPALRVALLHSTKARALLKQGKLTQAGVESEKAMALLDENMPALERAKILSGHAEVLTLERKLDKANETFQKVLTLEKENGGTESPADLVRYAKCLLARNELAESATVLRRAIAIDEEQLGKGHPALAADFNNLAIIECKQEKFTEAESSMNSAVQIAREYNYVDLPDWLDTMAAILSKANKVKDADALASEARTLRTKEKQAAASANSLQ